MPPIRPTTPYVPPQPPIEEEPIIVRPEPPPTAAAKTQIPSLSTVVDAVIEFDMGLPALALDYAIGPTVAQSVKDYGSKALEGSERRGARNRLASRFEAKVRDRVLGRLDILQTQLGDEYHRALGPSARPARDSLRAPIKRAQELQAKLDSTDETIATDAATDLLLPKSISWALKMGQAVASAADIIDESKSLDENFRSRAKLVDEYRALIHEYPAIGALDVSEVDAHTTDAGLRTLLQSGFEEKQTELHELRRRVQSGDIPVLQLENVVNETKAEMGISKERAAAGHQDSELLLEHLAFETHAQETIDGLLFTGTVTISLAAFLATGPLAAAGLGAAGVAVGTGSAAYNIEMADDVRDSARVGLEDNSQMTDRDAADVRFVLAAAEGVMAVADVGFAAKGLVKGAKATKEALEAAADLARHEAVTDVAQVAFKVEVPQQSLHRAYLPSADAAPTLSSGRTITPNEPTLITPAFESTAQRAAGFVDEAPVVPMAKRVQAETVTMPVVQTKAARVRPNPAKVKPNPANAKPNAAARPAQPLASTEPVAQGALREARGEVSGQGQVLSGRVRWTHTLKQLLASHDPAAVGVIREAVGEHKLGVLAQKLEPMEFARLANEPPQLLRFADTPVETLQKELNYWFRDVDRVVAAGPVSPFAELESLPVNQSLPKPPDPAQKSMKVGDLISAARLKTPA